MSRDGNYNVSRAKKPGEREDLEFTKVDERTTLDPGEEIEYATNPSVPFRGFNLLADDVTPKSANGLMVTSIRIAHCEQLAVPNVPLVAMLTQNPVIDLPTCNITQVILVRLKNEGTVPVSFRHLRMRGRWVDSF